MWGCRVGMWGGAVLAGRCVVVVWGGVWGCGGVRGGEGWGGAGGEGRY